MQVRGGQNAASEYGAATRRIEFVEIPPVERDTNEGGINEAVADLEQKVILEYELSFYEDGPDDEIMDTDEVIEFNFSLIQVMVKRIALAT